ncbi:MAG TPA: ATP-binding cassette domain-containing protein [Phycisphaerae bacterium]|nr:ATP-binding cassette domain-containing protein [Phycisphaerae bacterium]
MIQAKNLTKWYGPTLAVDHVSFHIEKGQIVGFLGPNGAGKTTTIRMLTCYMPASSGSASVAGFDCFSDSLAVRQQIGYLPESVPLYSEMRVREYLAFRARLRKIPRSERSSAVGRAADLCGVEAFVNRPIGQLSKGMRQRVGLAEALMHNPSVLVLDEPTIGLDPTQIRDVRTLIKRLAETHTIMFSTHILPEVEAICERIIIIAGGRIVASGSPEELTERITGGSRLIAEVQGPRDQVVGAVEQMSGVSKVASQPSDGWNRLTIEVVKGQDVRPEIAKVVTHRGWALRELRREVTGLEDFFVQITAEQNLRRES